ncbi:MAG: aminotransferase class V-fold PLP-dependent enzyme, partial [Clostridia bacterium]|nr:aminotransferase class V-fold PLP-dependent enzyme [Clostridia bacterium]
PDVILVTMMMVNNETGAVYPIPRVAKMMKSRCPDSMLHVDATQGYMKIPFRTQVLMADMITLSSHKIGGPKGVGALCVNKSVLKARGISALILGGGQEDGLRSGTENVPGIAAFGVAARLAGETLANDIKAMEQLRSYLLDRLSCDERLKEIRPALPVLHAPHILNITLPNIKSETMLHFLSSRGIYVSSGSACSSNSSHSSPALIAYGHTQTEADHSIRISFCPSNTPADIDALCEALAEGLSRLARVK